MNLLLAFFMAGEKQRGSGAACVCQALLCCCFLIPSPFPFQGTPGKPGPRGQRGPTVRSHFFILVPFQTLSWPKGNWDVLGSDLQQLQLNQGTQIWAGSHHFKSF